MSASEAQSVLRRKAAVGRQVYQARAMTAARALRLSVPKAADELFDMALAVIGITHRRLPREEAMKFVPEGSLLMLLDGNDGRPGAAVSNMALASALVQQQTMGRIHAQNEAEEERKPTRTEAMLFAPLLDGVLSMAAPMPEIQEDADMLSGMRFGAWMESPRLLDIALEEDEYVHFSLTLDVAAGARQGKVDLLLPLAQEETSTGADQSDGAAPMEQVAMGLEAMLDVVLTRFDLSLAELSSLSAGDVLPISSTAVQNAEMVTITGRCIGRGKLGQIDGKRALRPEVTAAPSNAPQRRAGDVPEGANGFETSDMGGGETIDMAPAPPPAGMPDLPAAGMPDLPAASAPDLPAAEILPPAGDALPDLPGEGIDLPASEPMPELASMPDTSDLPELGGLPAAGEDGGLPDLPDMSDLPELGELPSLPDLAG